MLHNEIRHLRINVCIGGWFEFGEVKLFFLFFFKISWFAAARNHVNRMCLAADVPLIESGTAGYLGQVTVIKKVSLCIITLVTLSLNHWLF